MSRPTVADRRALHRTACREDADRAGPGFEIIRYLEPDSSLERHEQVVRESQGSVPIRAIGVEGDNEIAAIISATPPSGRPVRSKARRRAASSGFT
jgi:hypothetical protein